MYSDLILGNTSRLKAAQCGQVGAANSVIVTRASAGPSAMSGSDTGFLISDALCAIALGIRRSGENPPSAASPVSDRAAQKARRVTINGVVRYLRFDQLFKNDLIFLSNSSNVVSTLIISPLTKKVGVELTFSTSPAYFWSAVILSISAWSLRQSSTACWLKPACLPIRVRVSAVSFNTQSFCCLNSRSTTAKYFPGSSLAMQRASIAPARAFTSSGN